MWFLIAACILLSNEAVRQVLEQIISYIVTNSSSNVTPASLLTILCLLGFLFIATRLSVVATTTTSSPPASIKSEKLGYHKNSPSWHWFQITNYVFTVIFITSVAFTMQQQQSSSTQDVSPPYHLAAAAGLGMSLVYFFAFFGVMFVSSSVVVKEEETSTPTTRKNDLLHSLNQKKIRHHTLESLLNNTTDAITVRRSFLKVSDNIPLSPFDYNLALNRNCESMIGYVPIPLGVVGPVFLNNSETTPPLYVPMATTEGCLVASTNRGLKALEVINTHVLQDVMTRAPCLEFPSALDVIKLKTYCNTNFKTLSTVFASTTSHGKLLSVETSHQAGRHLYLRIVCNTGEAMGMNIVSKGTIAILSHLQSIFPQMKVISVSGNVCTDKKQSAANWILGRGKSVVAEATVSALTVQSVLRTDVSSLVKLHTLKNLQGSAVAGTTGGGQNAHAANIVAAIFIATGQDPAQVVESSLCLTSVEQNEEDGSLYIAVTMPCIEVGTIGGGTHLPCQAACIDMVTSTTIRQKKAQHLASVIAAVVLAGELSLLAALATGDLVSSHLRLNRKTNA